MGRSSREETVENRAKIVEAASRLFRHSGVDAVSISEIMTAVGMTQGGFYKHFESKEALAAEACSTAFVKTKAAWSGVAERASRPSERLADLINFYLTPKPADRTCPMVAFNQDASSAQDGSFAGAYATGIEDLFTQFDGLSDASGPQESRERNLVLFAAMVGANIFARAGAGGGGLGRDFKNAILSFASSRKRDASRPAEKATSAKPLPRRKTPPKR